MSHDDHTTSSSISRTYIYGLTDPRTGAIRYVGKSDNPKRRLGAHVARSNTYRWHSATWVRSLLEQGIKPGLVILEEVSPESWPDAERKWIKKFRDDGVDLTNVTEGGIAPEITQESRAKMSAAKKANPSVITPETRAKMTEGKRGKKRGPLTPEWRAKIGAALRGKPIAEETKRKSSATKMGHVVTPETRAKMSAAKKCKHLAEQGRITCEESSKK